MEVPEIQCYSPEVWHASRGGEQMITKDELYPTRELIQEHLHIKHECQLVDTVLKEAKFAVDNAIPQIIGEFEKWYSPSVATAIIRTVKQSMIIRKLGVMSGDDVAEINERLKAALELDQGQTK